MASYIIYKTQNYLVFNDAAGSFVQQIGLKRVIVEMAVFVVLCFGLCMVRHRPADPERRNSVEKV